MALDVLNGQIDKGTEFSEAIDRALKMYPVSQDDLTEAYDNQ
jgi:ABC-type phosphate/phosphonate transport system substrate-binding protein